MKPIEADNLDASLARLEKRVTELGAEIELLLQSKAAAEAAAYNRGLEDAAAQCVPTSTATGCSCNACLAREACQERIRALKVRP